MGTFDQLGPEERAVLELLLKRGRSYASVAEALDLEEEDVAELAHAALRELTPVTHEAVEELDRGAIGNWVIGQATRGEAADARNAAGHDGPARAWAGSLLDALDGVASAGTLPELPELESGRARRGGGAAAAGTGGRRRFLVPGLAALAAILAVVLVITLLSGDDDNGGGGGSTQANTNTSAQNQPQPKVEAQGELKAKGGEEATGAAAVYDQSGTKLLLVQAQVPKSTDLDAYEVWLYNSDSDARSVGVQATDANGVLQGTAQVGKDYTKYKTVVISREQRNTQPKKPTKIVAQATLGPPTEAPAQGSTGTETTPGGG